MLALSRALGVDPITSSLLIQREIKSFNEARDFFRPKLGDLHPPFDMKDMQKAVDRLQQALEEDHGIMVFGDYDVDGTTSVALLVSFLQNIAYEKHDFYIPDRYKEGYGLSKDGIDEAVQKGYRLMVCLDCGIKAVELVDYANEQGLDIIICDHHRPGDQLPNAAAILDPKQDDCNYPYKELSGCGIGFKLIQAWSEYTESSIDLESYLDLCAISIACDIVPMDGENRVLSYYGLRRINLEPRPGVKAIFERTGKLSEVENDNLVFIIGPRINAAGRIRHASEAAKLLLSTDEVELNDLVDKIEEYNNERRTKDKDTTEHALQMISEDEFLSQSESTVLYHHTWHKGVVGIVASRLIEKYYRPTIVLTESEGKLSGSARSVHDFDVYEAIDACSEELIQFGGHKYAAGLTMDLDRFERFKERFEQEVSKRIRKDQKIPELLIDLELKLSDINLRLYRRIRQMAPFGPANMKPLFMTKVLKEAGSKKVGSDKTHLKTTLKDPDGALIKGIAFGMADKLELLNTGEAVDVVYTLELNEWRGRQNVEMMIKDIRPHS